MIACPSCGARLPGGSRFCLSCGAGLDAAATGLPLTEERKVVTTLFCDLVGFTAMSEGSDPEDVDALLREYSARARRAIEAHGGVVEKFIGDAVVGVFGVPRVHEDDPERAVRAALRLIEMLEGMTRPDGPSLQARCGVNTGEALVRLDVDPLAGLGFLTGDAVNTAARLQAAAPPGGVAVGALTHELTKRAVMYEELPGVVAKGKAEPVAAWRAVRPVARTGLRTAGLTSTRFLGRELELAALHGALERASDAAEARFVLVVGEPGIGKSRLVLEFSRALAASTDLFRWRQGRCLAYGEGVTFWPLGEILKEHAGIYDSDDVATVEAKLEAVLPEGEDGAWLRQRLRPLLGLTASQAAREENFAAWARLLESMAGDRPAVLVVEDLHWAGEAMLAFLEYVLACDLAVPLLIVATTRPELLRQHEGALTSPAGSDRLHRITLPSLSRTDTGALVADLFDGDQAGGVGAHIAELAGGNPLYAEQYARLLLDGGFIARTGDTLDVAGTAELPLPKTVQAVLAARLDTLPREHKALLCDAAVIGETFWQGAVAELAGRDSGAVGEAMAALGARDLVRPAAAPTMEGEPEYLFWHALARDVAYGQLPRKVRARKHQAVARWIEGRTGERGDEFAEIVAHHYTTALDLARAARDAELASSLVAPTVACLARAGERALRLDVAAAERYCARGLELAAPDAPERPRLLQRWAQALWLRRHYREAAAAYRESIAGLQAAGEKRTAAVAMCHLVSVLTWLGEPCFDITRAAVELLADDGPSPERAEVLGLYALGLILLDEEPASVVEAADEAVDICRLLELPEPAMALSCRGFAKLQLGDLDGLGDYERAIEAAREQGLGVERTTIELNYADLVFIVKGAQARLDVLHDGAEFALTHGLDSYAIAYRGTIVAALLSAGEWDRALREAEELIVEYDAHEELWDVLTMRSLQALILSAKGEAGVALPFVSWIVDQGRESEIGWTRMMALYAGAAVHLSLGHADEGLGLLAESFASPRASAAAPDDLPQAVRMTLMGGDAKLARRLATETRKYMPAKLLPLQQHAVATLDALFAEVDGDRAAAAGFADAAARWHEFGVPYEEGHALLGEGRCLVALGRAPEAAAPLAAAREIFARLGARPALEETEEWLGRASTS